ncbi:MAG: radical SAM protein [Methylocystaceae bacterium]
MLRMLYADKEDRILEHPRLKMLGRSGGWVLPEPEELIPLPEGATLVSMPGYLAAGYDVGKNTPRVEDQGWAVAALLPQGYTRTLLPAGVSVPERAELPLFGYTAVGMKNGRFYAAALPADEDYKWNPAQFNTPQLPELVAKLKAARPGNKIVSQLSRCALEYGCFTAQNIFYHRWEGGIPTTQSCNARCLGCLSEAHSGVASPQCRLSDPPSANEICELGCYHLQAPEAIMSFGQGCEGEPSINGLLLAEAVKDIRRQTSRGTININTNAGHLKGITALIDAGLDSMRVTMFSCDPDTYRHYHRPAYDFADVEGAVDYAVKSGVRVAVNLLVFPGFSDTGKQYQALGEFISRHQVSMVQMRNLNLDPETMFAHFPIAEEAFGMVELTKQLKTDFPDLIIGSYTHPYQRER